MITFKKIIALLAVIYIMMAIQLFAGKKVPDLIYRYPLPDKINKQVPDVPAEPVRGISVDKACMERAR